jgi:hypothetical protein
MMRISCCPAPTLQIQSALVFAFLLLPFWSVIPAGDLLFPLFHGPFPCSRPNLRIPYTLRPYTPGMIHLAIFGMRVLETLFFIGLAGSAVVVAISFVEDFRVLLHRDRPWTASQRPSGEQEYPQPAGSRRSEPDAAASRA